jgi:hypothetical protein
MRTLWAGLALAALAAACTDQPTTPLLEEPLLAEVEAPALAQAAGGNGALIWRFSAGSGFCWMSDAVGNLVMTPCQIVYRKNGSFTWTWHATRVNNPTGKAVHYGPTNPPLGFVEGMKFWFDVEPDAEGRIPICDWNVLTDPEMNWLVCSTNWHSTISAGGVMTGEWIADPAHTWTKWFPFPW